MSLEITRNITPKITYDEDIHDIGHDIRYDIKNVIGYDINNTSAKQSCFLPKFERKNIGK